MLEVLLILALIFRFTRNERSARFTRSKILKRVKEVQRSLAFILCFCTQLLKFFEDTEFYNKIFEKSRTKFCNKALIGRNIRLERSMRSEKSKNFVLILALIFRFARFEWSARF